MALGHGEVMVGARMYSVFVHITVVVIFGASALLKALTFGEFAMALPAFGVPRQLAPNAAALVITAESAVCLMMFTTGLLSVIGLGLATVLLAIFAVALAWGRARRVDSGCHCFGTNGLTIGYVHIARNIVLLALTLSAAVLPQAEPGVQSRFAGPLNVPLADFMVAGGLAVMVSFVWSQLPELVELMWPVHSRR
jgi:hypothetical protein